MSENPRDECVCGCWRGWHYDDGGSCLLNIGHPEDVCREFQIYRPATDDKREML